MEAKNTQRSTVRLGYDGRVHKIFRGPNAQERFENEVHVLRYLERKQCPNVPTVLETYPERLELVTTNCGSRVEQMSEAKLKQLFDDIESYGVRHDDAFLRNITYRSSDGRFCVIDFEFATILEPEGADELEEDVNIKPKAFDAKVALKWSGMTHVGRFRPNNEDDFLAAMIDSRGISYLGYVGESSIENREFIFAVSDGMGGQQSGEFASKIATQKITLQMPQHFNRSEGPEKDYCFHVLNRLIESIHRDMLNLSRYDSNCSEMGATLTLTWFRQRKVYFAHVGDSRLYYLAQDGGMTQATEDHSHVGWLRRTGKINEREARYHPQRSALSQCLGSGHRYLRPQIGVLDYQPGDTFLLATDGVMEGLWDRAIEEMIRNPPSEWANQTPAARLVLAAVAESGKDNASAVVVQTSPKS